MLTLFEELYLMAIDDEKGVLVPSAKGRLGCGLAGAVLAQLALMDKIKVNENHRLEISDNEPTGDELMDEFLREVKESKPRKVSYWVSALNEHPKLMFKQISERLVVKGILNQEDDHLFWPSQSSNPQADVPLKYGIKRRLRGTILANEDIDLHNLTLLSIIRACNLLKLVYTKDERKAAQRRIHEKFIGEALDNPIAQTIEEIERAVSDL